MNGYNVPEKDLFGKRCLIKTGLNQEPFLYRIVDSGSKSNCWVEPPLMICKSPVIHDRMEEVLIVVCDTLINENSKLVRVAKKDVEMFD